MGCAAHREDDPKNRLKRQAPCGAVNAATPVDARNRQTGRPDLTGGQPGAPRRGVTNKADPSWREKPGRGGRLIMWLQGLCVPSYRLLPELANGTERPLTSRPSGDVPRCHG